MIIVRYSGGAPSLAFEPGSLNLWAPAAPFPSTEARKPSRKELMFRVMDMLSHKGCVGDKLASRFK